MAWISPVFLPPPSASQDPAQAGRSALFGLRSLSPFASSSVLSRTSSPGSCAPALLHPPTHSASLRKALGLGNEAGGALTAACRRLARQTPRPHNRSRSRGRPGRRARAGEGLARHGAQGTVGQALSSGRGRALSGAPEITVRGITAKWAGAPPTVQGLLQQRRARTTSGQQVLRSQSPGL